MKQMWAARVFQCFLEDRVAGDNELQGFPLSSGGPDPFGDLDVPPSLEESLARHRRHLAQLVRTMKTAGITDETIEVSVSALMAAYKAEVIAAIRRMKG